MKRFIIISSVLHISLFLLFIYGNLTFLFKKPDLKVSKPIQVQFLETLPINKNLKAPVFSNTKEKQRRKEQVKKTSPPPKPSPGIKTKVKKNLEKDTLNDTKTKKNKTNDQSQKIKKDANKNKLMLKKNQTKILNKSTEKDTALKEKEDQKTIQKASPGIEKKKQEIESVDALLNTLLPDTGGKRDNMDTTLQEPDTQEMPEYLENEAVNEIRSQIEEVWNYNPTSGIDFYLRIKIDSSGTILDVKLIGTENQNALQKAAAESAYRATLRLGKFELNPQIFTIQHHKDGWDEIEVHFHPINE